MLYTRSSDTGISEHLTFTAYRKVFASKCIMVKICYDTVIEEQDFLCNYMTSVCVLLLFCGCYSPLAQCAVFVVVFGVVFLLFLYIYFFSCNRPCVPMEKSHKKEHIICYYYYHWPKRPLPDKMPQPGFKKVVSREPKLTLSERDDKHLQSTSTTPQ